MSRLAKPWKELQDLVQNYAELPKVSEEMLATGLRQEGYGDFKGKFYVSGDLTQPIAVDTVAQKIAGYLKRPEPFRVIHDFEARREAKRSKLTLALMQDSPTEAKKQLGRYFAFLEENPQLTIPGRGQDDERSKYIDTVVDDTVINSIHVRKKVLSFLDMLETVIVDAGEEFAESFCQGTSRLYASLSPERVSVFVNKGIELAKEYQQLPQRVSRKKRELAQETVINYFNCKSEPAQATYSRLLQEETVQLLQESRREQRTVVPKLEHITRQLAVVDELRRDLVDYSGKFVQAERDRNNLEREVAGITNEREHLRETLAGKVRELVQRDEDFARQRTLGKKLFFYLGAVGLIISLALAGAVYNSYRANTPCVCAPSQK